MPVAQFLILILNPVFSLLSAFGLMVASRRWSSVSVVLFSLALGVIAYNLRPVVENDLTRYYTIMSHLGTMSFSGALAEIISRIDVGSYFLMYTIALIGDYNLLQFIAVSSTYILILIPILHTMNKNESSWRNKAFIMFLFFALFEFINVYSGVRNYIALSLFFFILYRDLGSGRKTPILMYFIPALFHISMVIPALLLIVSKLRIRSLSTVVGVLLAISGLVLPSVLALVSLSGVANDLGIAQKLQWYSVDYGAILHSHEYLFRAMIFALLLFTFVIVRLSAKTKSEQNGTRRMVVFRSITWMLVLLSIGLLPANETFFMRFSLLAELCMVWYILMNIKELGQRRLVVLIAAYSIVALMSLHLQIIYLSTVGANEPWLEYIFKPLFLIGSV